MKVKRQKHVRKMLTFYRSNYSFESPYKTLIDGTFCRAALNGKINIGEQLPKYLDSEVKLCTTSCVIAECRALGSLLYGPLKLLEQYSVVPCSHKRPVLATNCLKKMAVCVRKGKLKYLIATQDATLTQDIRRMAGVPLLYIAFNAINLEPPSEASKLKAQAKIQELLTPSVHERMSLDELKNTAPEKDSTKPKRKRRMRGPNPLSCKKKKKVQTPDVGESLEKKKRRKKHAQKRLPVNNSVMPNSTV